MYWKIWNPKLVSNKESFACKDESEEKPNSLTQIVSTSPASAADDSATKETRETVFETRKIPPKSSPQLRDLWVRVKFLSSLSQFRVSY